MYKHSWGTYTVKQLKNVYNKKSFIKSELYFDVKKTNKDFLKKNEHNEFSIIP